MMKTAEGKWILFAVEGGEQAEFWPIDARALLELGSHTTEPPAGVEPSIPAAPPRRAGVPQTSVAQTFVAPEGEASPKARKKVE
jgi:hypothetical protein